MIVDACTRSLLLNSKLIILITLELKMVFTSHQSFQTTYWAVTYRGPLSSDDISSTCFYMKYAWRLRQLRGFWSYIQYHKCCLRAASTLLLNQKPSNDCYNLQFYSRLPNARLLWTFQNVTYCHITYYFIRNIFYYFRPASLNEKVKWNQLSQFLYLYFIIITSLIIFYSHRPIKVHCWQKTQFRSQIC